MNRVKTIDYLKTIAIVGVLLFHIGAIKNGYLGVETFFVVSGFLMIKGINRSIDNHSFNPIRYIIKRAGSLWLLIAIAGVLSLSVGFFVMLPDDYENLAESVIASDFFANNILQAITTKNYWDVVNTYKPLMHTWYVGVLIQSIVFLSVILWLVHKIWGKNGVRNALIMITALSFIAYCLPFFSTSDKFYYFPFRLFEITIGCLITYIPQVKIPTKTLSMMGNLGIIIIFFMLFSGISLPDYISLIIVILSSALVIWSHSITNEDYGICEKVYNVITVPGRYSYDVYIWHQVVIAFLYYSVFQTYNLLLVLSVVIITVCLSAVSIVIRKRLKALNVTWKRIVVSIFIAFVGCAISAYIYLNAGVVRDVPELGVDKTDIHRNMHAEYVDIPYSWDEDFDDDSKIHILVLGDSFGRDFANILNESVYAERIEISYIYGADPSKEADRVSEADFVFYGASGWNIPDTLNSVPNEKLYVVGNKSFGNSNGIIYINRNHEDYFEQRVVMPDDMILHNNALRGIYGDHYIDMITPLLDGDELSVFTDDGYYISQDCRHLTKQGAQYYARILDLSFIVSE